VGQIYLYDNALLKKPLTLEHIKPRLLGHWGTTPGLNFVYVHLNRVIKEHDLNALYITGPGHGGPGLVANAYLEGTYSEVYPNISQDEDGLKRLFKQFSFPAASPAMWRRKRPAPFTRAVNWATRSPTPNGAAYRQFPICSSRASSAMAKPRPGRSPPVGTRTSFINPVCDGAVLPIPAPERLQDRRPHRARPHSARETGSAFRGYGYAPCFVEGDDPAIMHQLMAAALDASVAEIHRIQRDARAMDSRCGRAGP